MEGKTKNNTFTKIKEWIKSHIAVTAVIAGVVIIVIATVIIVANDSGKKSKGVDVANATTEKMPGSNDDTTTEYNETDTDTEPELQTDPVLENIELESYTIVADDGTINIVKPYVTPDGEQETDVEPLTGSDGDIVTVAPSTTAPEEIRTTAQTETEKPTEKPTEKVTEKPTEKPTEAETVAPVVPSVEIKNGTVVKINGTNGVAVIPSTYEGKAVTTIPASVVVSSSVKELTIPSSITKWEELAFKDNLTLTKVKVDSNAIPDGAFAGCTALTTAEFGSNCKKIPLAAFGRCSSLTTVKIGRGVTYIDEAFYSCVSLKEIYIPKNVTTLASFGVFDDVWTAYEESTGITLPEIDFNTGAQIKGHIPNLKICFEGTSINITDGYWIAYELDVPVRKGTTNTVTASNLNLSQWGCDSLQKERYTVKFGVAYPY